ncbi:MAG: carbamoyl-phosphate synthase large subunit [Alphaproteobacteria bacterium]|nr:carbamoyl-phosphate synthase large subunit [Alphaproteobacteria bacterium]MDE2013898.1 carbamoyl-phosphate synthase large subunit [Alphaproteobacteria bacterium]MDE2073069.1 carbamoyl-phosphate synthase large subunit [Alphaproteobacteria bacterium]MDE2351779.1 carbamoyl-phosphate synthase large subunit [Alphaproteobacteria bacterium]
MPKRQDIHTVLIIGAGPIVIGQACEFDYSGAQACKALKAEGYRVVLVNSNPATIMTDPGLADATYIEPITPEFVEKIIAREAANVPDGRIFALLPTMGGQTALNTALSLRKRGVLEKYNVELIGASADAIDKAEDRELFRQAMLKIGLDVPRGITLKGYLRHKKDEHGNFLYDAENNPIMELSPEAFTHAVQALDEVGLPAVIRPSFTLGGTGGGIAYNRDEFFEIVEAGLDASPTNEVLIEQSVLGWKEYEMEVVRDRADNAIIICSIENVDPMGVHTGDSITVAPALTLTDKEYQRMRTASIAVLREIGVETGGSNVQFAVNPVDGRMVIIEMNPRVSRSSALASKATGFPIAKVAAKLAVGYTLDELQNDITKVTPASFEPTIDYVVTKIPRFTFEKFPGAEPLLTTSMKSVGEAMAIGRTFAESLQKALRSMETGLTGLDEIELANDKDAIRAALARPSPDRLRFTAEAVRLGFPMEEIQSITRYDPWFLGEIERIVAAEKEVAVNGMPQDEAGLRRLKAMGFSDARLAHLAGLKEKDIRALRARLKVRPVFKRIDTCAAEFQALTPYMYSTYESPVAGAPECESHPTAKNKVIILGGGPNRIGQGIEFDYCCCHAAFSLSERGFETVMVNCNPETVSTDYDTSDRLYFEPLTAEDVLEIVRTEQAKGTLAGIIVQFGGQTPLKLAGTLVNEGIPLLGTSADAIDLAEDRKRFQVLLHQLGLKQPKNATALTPEETVTAAAEIGYPVMLRPSYVLGGRGMVVAPDEATLKVTVQSGELFKISGDHPVLIDAFLHHAIEIDVDAIGDGTGDVFVAGIMEHIEEAGVHSGDSACALPPHSLPPATIAEIERQTIALARALDVRGLMNVQYAVQNGDIYVLEVNPRASRTVPFVAKAIGVPVAAVAARVMAGEKLASFNLSRPQKTHIAVKEAVMPFARFPGVDTILGPEMRSTGEVMGLDTNFGRAFAKSQIGAGLKLPQGGTAFISVKEADKALTLAPARQLQAMNFEIIATRGTAKFLNENGVEAKVVNKVLEGRPHIVDALKNGEVQLVFNTTEGAQALADSLSIRRTALQMKVPYYTTIAGAAAATQAVAALRGDSLEVAPLQSYA